MGVMPTEGDVVIRRSKGRECTLEVYPEPPQIRAKDYPTALRLARGFNKITHVKVWFVGKADAFNEVEPTEDS